MKTLNGVKKVHDFYSEKTEIEKLSDAINSEILPQISRIEYSQELIFSALQEVRKDLSVIKERNIHQDVIFTIAKKIPYFFFFTVGLTLLVSGKDFSFTDWFINQAKHVIHYEA